MRFVDQCKVKVVAGDGGNGAAAFRREKFVPFGGPSGGDGGRGASVVFVGDEGMSTLLDFTHARLIQGARGEHGHGSDCHGRGGEDREERVPIGTQIRDTATGELIADVTAHEQRVIVAQGGKGGRGNIHFATPHDRAPRRAEKGDPGEIREIELELKIMADVGLLGFPNVGKSTFVSAVSAARPRVADYPFTTLVPSLGVVAVGGGRGSGGNSFVIADIPGLIPGASEGIGLGIRFLKHVERTRALLHLVTLDEGEGREPLADYRALRQELTQFSPELALRPEIVVLSKADITEVREVYEALAARFWDEERVKLRLVSAATRVGVEELVNHLYGIVHGEATEDDMPGERAAFFAARKAALKKAKAAAKKKAAPAKKPVVVAKKKAPAKKPVVVAKKKAPAKKPVVVAKKKAPAKKPVVVAKKKAPAKKPVVVAKKKAPAKKPVAAKKKAPARKPVAVAKKKAPARKPVAVAKKKAPAKKAPARKPVAAKKAGAPVRKLVKKKSAGSRKR
jgi:GTP-binding protein